MPVNQTPESFVPSNNSRSFKSLSEKIRDLGITPPNKRTSSSQLIDIKFEENRSSNYAVMIPNINLEQIIYFQPEISYDETSPEKSFYRINQGEKSFQSPEKISRISDIEVKSYRPSKTVKFRAKRRSSMLNRIEDILNKHKVPLLSREASEESIVQIVPKWEKEINDLPESVLQKIFLHFTLQERNLLLSLVCKSWYYMLKDPIFWTELEFYGDKVEEMTIFNLIRKYSSLRRLSLVYVPKAVNVLEELCRYAAGNTVRKEQSNYVKEFKKFECMQCNHSLTHLAVKYCNVSTSDFSRIIHRVISCCTNLEVLDIKGMPFQSEGFYLELGRLRNLRSINLTGNNMLRSQDLITLSLNCRNLRELKLLDIAIDNEEGSPLKDEDLTFIISHLQSRLQTLKLDMQQLRNVSYQAILKCSNLTTLVLKNCLYLSSSVFRQLSDLQKLRKLKITRAINIKPEDFQFVFASGNLNRIETLDINGCWGVGELGLQGITEGLTFLRSLSLKNCKSINGNHLMYLSNCPNLTELNLAHTEVESNQLPSLYQYIKGLRTLVIDTEMDKQSIIRQLRRFYPSLKIIISFSEFQKDERILED